MFRLAGWGWGVSIALALFVGAVIVIGYLRETRAGTPRRPPTERGVRRLRRAQRRDGCARARGRGRDDPDEREAAAAEVEARVAAADEALADLPDW